MRPVVILRAMFLLCLLLVLAIGSSALPAQVPLRPRPDSMRPPPRMRRPPPLDAAQAQRMQLQRQIRQGFWRAAKVRIGFTDEQMTRLEQTSQRFDQRRRALGQEEKALRVTLHNETLADTAANQSTIASALDRLTVLQHQRIDLQADEQKEFAQFMTPLQRAKFLALQDQIRKRVADIARGRPDSAVARPVPPDAP